MAVIDTNQIVNAIARAIGDPRDFTLLHGPTLAGNAGAYVKQCVDTAWVSSAGSFVNDFEARLAAMTGAAHAVAVVNGTCALQIALMLAGVGRGDEVLMPSFTFVATANACSHAGGVPHFVDIEPRTLGVDPQRLAGHLQLIAEMRDGVCYNRQTGRKIAALVPMHCFGHPAKILSLVDIAKQYNIALVEDAAESLGSYVGERHTGTFGQLAILSFNGNKIVTTGGGGAIVTNDEAVAKHAKHITSTAKAAHPWEFIHDEIGYNFRMPNINAALGCGQLERLDDLLAAKRKLAGLYTDALADVPGVSIMQEPEGCRSNYWLQTLILDEANKSQRDELLMALNDRKLQSRPAWTPMHQLTMYAECPRADLPVTEEYFHRVINIPSTSSLADPQLASA